MDIHRGLGARLVARAALGAVLIAWPAAARAGEVYGRITAGGASVGEGASVAVACGDKAYPARPTDKSGTYHIVVGATGKCTLTVTYKGQSAELAIVSYEDESQVDIALETKDGKLQARRK
jgi:hypothetical protein